MDLEKLHSSFRHQSYLVRRKVFKLLGGAFHVYTQSGDVVLYCKQKAFKLKEDFRIYEDDSEANELLTIKARQVIDFGATYDVLDSKTGETVGSLRRKGFASMIRDTWLIFDPAEREIGTLLEDSTMMAILRRFLSNLIPQSFRIDIDGAEAASFQQHFNPFVFKGDLTLDANRIDPRMALAAAILLLAIEGRQQ